MLHGLFGSSSNWEVVQKELAGRFHTIAMDLPYLELEKEFCNIDFLTDYVKCFLQKKDITKANFMGNSLGGHLALNMAIRNADIVESLILTGSSGLFERTYDKELQVHPTRAYLKEKIGEIFYDKSLATDQIVDQAYSFLLDKEIKRRVIRVSKSAKSYNMQDMLGKITCPTLLIWGKHDTITPKDVAFTFRENIRKSKLVFLEKCCHAPMMEHPQEFSRLSLRFLLNHKDETFFS